MKSGEYINWDILVRSMSGKLSEEELKIFEAWRESDEAHRDYYDRMVAEWESETIRERDPLRIQLQYDSLLQKRRQYSLRRRLRRVGSWSVAAMLLITVGMLWLLKDSSNVSSTNSLTEISPGRSRAYLAMYDGTNISLDEKADSLDITLGDTEIHNHKGTVKLVNTNKQFEEVKYNTLVVPRNGEYHIVLDDGTEVWLNADSRMKFPTNFKEKERRVLLAGEAYFKVTHCDIWPFIVETDLGHIRVYGTEFNVRRYVDEQDIRTTLVQGSVGFCSRESSSDAYVLIEPGYQISYKVGEKSIVKKINVANEIAWRKQLFCFESCPLEEIMRDIARWYDVEVVFEMEYLKKLNFTCSLDRYENIEKLLRFFEEVYDIEFKVDQKQIIVKEK